VPFGLEVAQRMWRDLGVEEMQKMCDTEVVARVSMRIYFGIGMRPIRYL
jgi:hypothetical protein